MEFFVVGFFLVLGYEICWVANGISFDYAKTQKKTIFLWIFKKEIFLIYTVLYSIVMILWNIPVLHRRISAELKSLWQV